MCLRGRYHLKIEIVIIGGYLFTLIYLTEETEEGTFFLHTSLSINDTNHHEMSINTTLALFPYPIPIVLPPTYCTNILNLQVGWSSPYPITIVPTRTYCANILYL